MKELSIEEKTNDSNYKTYTELINRLEDVKDAIKKQNYGIAMDILCKPYPEYQITISPELKESDGEKIRKAVINFINREWGSLFPFEDYTKEQFIAWLEKQGEHAKFRDSIQVGDKVTRNRDGMLVNLSQLKRVAKPAEKQGEHDMGISEDTKQELEDNLNKALEKETPESCNEFLDEQKPADTEKGANGNEREIPISEPPLTIKHAREVMGIKQNPAWSEVDDVKINRIVACLENLNVADNDILLKDVAWLKSLRERYTWKPSDEQIKALDSAIHCYAGISPTNNREVYALEIMKEQLKKLMEE